MSGGVQWRRSAFEIFGIESRAVLMVRGYVAGPFGVHYDRADVNGHGGCCGKWMLTHLQTGALLGCFRSRQAATASGDRLAAACRWDFGAMGDVRSTVNYRGRRVLTAEAAWREHVPVCPARLGVPQP